MAGLWLAAVAAVAVAGCNGRAVAPTAPACFRVQDPYDQPGSWTRGNFHMHSKHSDGALFPAQLVEIYHNAGFGVLCISDHNSYGDQDGGIVPDLQSDSLVHDWNGDGTLHPENRFGSGVEAVVRDWSKPWVAWSKDGWYRSSEVRPDSVPVVLSGCEATFHAAHIGLVGSPPGPIEPPDANPLYIERTRQAGGFVFLAHPAMWNASPGNLTRFLPMREFDGIEIVNGNLLSKAEPADATPLWDALLSSGYRLWGLANDDEHTWIGAEIAHPFTASNVLLYSDATPEGFLEALHRGSLYGTTGLYFGQLGVKEGLLQAWAPKAVRLRFVGKYGRVLQDVPGDRAAYAVQGWEGYVRVEATGMPEPGMRWAPGAWSQPFFVQGVPCEETSGSTAQYPQRRGDLR